MLSPLQSRISTFFGIVVASRCVVYTHIHTTMAIVTSTSLSTMLKSKESQLIVVNSVPGLYLLKFKDSKGKIHTFHFMRNAAQ